MHTRIPRIAITKMTGAKINILKPDRIKFHILIFFFYVQKSRYCDYIYLSHSKTIYQYKLNHLGSEFWAHAKLEAALQHIRS